MKKNMPNIMESIFDVSYLLFDLIAGCLFLINSSGRSLFILYGILTLLLGIGDAFHLVPRVLRVIYGTSESIEKGLGRGLQVSSITMTIFYVLLMYIWKLTFQIEIPTVILILVWISALARIVICLLPQNNWYHGGNMKLSMIRNGIFLVTGLCILYLYAGTSMYKMSIAIAISFACYIPVTLLSKKKPMIGMLMIPKTIAYIWMIAMGLSLL